MKKDQVNRVVYKIDWGGGGGGSEKCSSTYIDETGRTLKSRAVEHRCPSCSTYKVSKQFHLQGRSPHQVSMDNIKILDMHPVYFSRVYVRQCTSRYASQTSTMRGKHQVPHIWNFLFDHLS